MYVVLVPIEVDPENVSIVSVTVTDDSDGLCAAKDSGGVHLMLVLVLLVAMVPDAVPHWYVIVWEKLLDCLVTVRVCSTPSVPLPAEIVDTRGIVVSVIV